jgi:ribosomal protein L37AE/L43A
MTEQSETVEACPHCDSSDIYARTTTTPAWYCNDCQQAFTEPVERERRAPGRPAGDGLIRHLTCYHCRTDTRTATADGQMACPHCGRSFVVWRARVAHLTGNKTTRTLAAGPTTSSELGTGGIDANIRGAVERLRPLRSASSATSLPHGDLETVYYLQGDLRAACRRFVEVNFEYVETVLNTPGNAADVLQSRWEDHEYRFLVEQYEFAVARREAADGGDAEPEVPQDD